MEMEQLNPQLLRQYGDAGFNFVLLHKPDDVKTTFFCKRSQKRKKLKTPIPVGKAPTQDNWPAQTVSFGLAAEHMKSGRNIGVQMSSAGYAVIDYDPRNDPKAGTSENALSKLLIDADLHGVDHASVTTGSRNGPVRGRHIYVKVDPAWRGRTKLDQKVTKYPGVEFKHSPGQQVVAAGSVHPTGGCYRFDEDSLPLVDAQRATAKLLEIFEIKKPQRGEASALNNWGSFSEENIRRALLGSEQIMGETEQEFLPGLDVDLYNGDHDKWLELMMSVHFATGGEAADVFVDWATSDPRYADDGDIIRERWDTLTQDGNGAVVTEGTMFKHFIDGGLHPALFPSVRVERAFEDLSEEDLLLDSVPESDEARVLRVMNNRHAMVMTPREPMYLKPGVSYVDNETPGYEMVSRSALKAFYENKIIRVQELGPNGGFQMREDSWFDFWNTHPRRREYQGWVFSPSNDSTDIDMGNAGVYLNLFQGWPLSKTNRGRGEWEKFRELIWKVLASENEEWFDFIMKWMAYSVQYPERPQEVLMVFQGPKGVGKSLVGERWKRMFGNGGMTTQRMEDLTGNFNGQLGLTCALLMEEGMWAGDKASENRLKQLVTGHSIRVENKFENAREVRNMLSIWMNTNEQWAVPATPDERRFAVFEARGYWPKNHPFFGQVIREMDYEGGLQALFFDLYHMDLGEWRPQGNIPMTPALIAQISTTVGPVAEWWGDILRHGECPYAISKQGGVPNWGEAPIYVHWKSFKDQFQASQHGKLSRKWHRNFDKTFKAEFGSIADVDLAYMAKKQHPETEEFFGLAADRGYSSSGRPRSSFIEIPSLPDCIEYGKTRGVMVDESWLSEVSAPSGYDGDGDDGDDDEVPIA